MIDEIAFKRNILFDLCDTENKKQSKSSITSSNNGSSRERIELYGIDGCIGFGFKSSALPFILLGFYCELIPAFLLLLLSSRYVLVRFPLDCQYIGYSKFS